MKIAICFSGQTRTAIKASENLIRYFGELYSDCDFFIHTWNVNTDKAGPPNSFEIIDDGLIDKLIEIYNPKKIKIENYNITNCEEFDNLAYKNGINNSMFYSFMQSIKLKKEYELENNFKYDYVIKIRFDLIFNLHRRLINDINMFPYEKENGIWIENISPEHNEEIDMWIDDVFYISTSTIMDKLSNYYNFFKESNKIVNYYNSFTYFIKLNNVKFFKMKKVDDSNKYFMGGYTIYRKEAYNHSPLTEFYKCLEFDIEYNNKLL
jgi:hypothetical protein